MNIWNVGKAKLHLPLIPKLNRSLYSHSHRRTRSLPHHKEEPISLNSSTHSFILYNPLLSLLDICKTLFHLKQIKAHMIITGLILDAFASSRLIAFCALSDSRYLDYSVKILKGIENPNAFSWNVTIRGFSESENPKEAILLYKEMLRYGGSRPDNFTYPVLFKVCADLTLNRLGHMILAHVFKLRLELVSHVHNASIHMFASCGEMENARKLFDESPVRDLVSWNSLINGYKKIGQAEKAIQVYKQMESEAVKPDDVTMIGLISSCAILRNLNLGKEFYDYIKENGLRVTIPLANSLIDMFSKCGDIHEARSIFDSLEKRTIVSWTTMISGYARCGLLDVCRNLFDVMEEKDVVLWNAMIGGSVQAKRPQEALVLFQEMQTSNTKPDEITMIHCLSACSQLGALDVGVWIHRYIEKHNLSLNVALGTSLVDMYAKCGNISKALCVFHGMQTRNSLTYTAIIGGLALHGDALTAISYFNEMIGAGLAPDEITFIGLLSACCHAGMIQTGRDYFSQMKSRFNLIPQLKHYSIMVDLLGRAGLLEEAEKLMKSMPMEADAAVWGALLFGCRMHGNVTMGEKAAKKLLELDPSDSGIYVLMDGMYGEADMRDDAKRARMMMNERGIEKIPGCSSIEVNGVVSEFIVRDKSNPESKKLKPLMPFPHSAMEGTTKWDPACLDTMDEVHDIYSNMKHIDQQVNAVSLVSSLEVELEEAHARIEDLESEKRSHKKKLEQFLKKVSEEDRAAWRSREHEKVLAIIDDMKANTNREKKTRQRLEIVNNKLVNGLADSKLSVKHYMQEYGKEMKAIELTEELCEELTEEIGEDKAEIEASKRESMSLREEVDDERRMLLMAEVWREERVLMKLIDAKVSLEETYSLTNL